MLFGIAAAAATMVITGCSHPRGGTSGDNVQEAYIKWQGNRAPVEQVVSECPDAEAKLIIDGVAVIPGKVYKYLADGADKAFAVASGRELFNGIKEDLKAGVSEDEIIAKMSEGDKIAYAAYRDLVIKQDFKSTKEKLDEIAKQLAEDGVKVAGALAAAKNCKFDGMNMIQKAGAIKKAISEIGTIKAQLADCLNANKYWSDLNAQDEDAQKLMQEYKVGK